MDGVPAGLPLTEEDVAFELSFRRPGREFVSPRRERDSPVILSGLFQGRTTGAPIAITVANEDPVSSFYEEVRYKPRPGHADLPYAMKYGYANWDYRGGGRASARETVARVAAGSVAKKLLMIAGTRVAGYLRSAGDVEVGEVGFEEALASRCSPVRVPRGPAETGVEELLKRVSREGDSVGGVVEIRVMNPPAALGEPVFDKLKADLAKALLSVPGVVGFEYGLGFAAARMRGSQANDEIRLTEGKPRYAKNSAGGILGGLSTGEEMVMRVAFKPTSSIRKPSKTVDLRDMTETEISVTGRHDPCIAVRGVSVVEAMVALVLADHSKRAGVIPAVRLSEEEAKRVQERWESYARPCGRARWLTAACPWSTPWRPVWAQPWPWT